MRTVDRLRQTAVDRAKAVVPLSMRRRVVRGRLAVRIWTAPLRATPDFLVIGAQRSGTSSLYKWLSRHPEVAASLRKEIEYFTVDYGRGPGWYKAHFPLRARRTVARLRGRRLLTFEATPDYIFDPRAPERAHHLLPEARLVLVLRDPAKRAVSHYHHMRRLGLEPLGIDEAIQGEEGRLAPEWERIVADPYHRATGLRRFSYAARGLYAEQIERWLEYFPRDRLLVLRFEDLVADPAPAFDSILDFLGLRRWHPPEFRNYSYVGEADAGYLPPSQATADFLAARFEKPNRHLAELLGEEMRWDSPAG